MKRDWGSGTIDNFEGTQEELQDMIAEIYRLADSGELLEKAELLSEEEVEELFGPSDAKRDVQ